MVWEIFRQRYKAQYCFFLFNILIHFILLSLSSTSKNFETSAFTASDTRITQKTLLSRVIKNNFVCDMTVVFPLHKKKTSGKKIRDREALSMSDVNHQNAKERKKKLNLFLFSFHSEVSLWDWQIERRNKTAKGISFNVWSFVVLLFFFFLYSRCFFSLSHSKKSGIPSLFIFYLATVHFFVDIARGLENNVTHVFFTRLTSGEKKKKYRVRVKP